MSATANPDRSRADTGFALDAYLTRIGLSGPVPVDAAGLDRLQRAHRLAIPFENLDIPLGRGIALAPGRVVAKLVDARRGGYCFEQNGLFALALAAMGFAVRPLLARVWLGVSETPPLTHTLLLVDLPEGPWIADAGFGGSYSPPMPLIDNATAQAPDGAAFRLRAQPGGWLLERSGHPHFTDGRGAGEGFLPQYSFTLETAHPTDLALSNHWTATAPGTRFTTHIVVSIPTEQGFASLLNGALTIDGQKRAVRKAADLDQVLRDTFGLILRPEEIESLATCLPSPGGS